MTDIDRYLTDDMIHVALRASDSANEGGVVGGRERMMRAALSAALPDIIQQAKAEALEAARGPYRCCPHCADDRIHDVEKDDHTVPCQICQNDVIQQAKTEALREAANDIERRINAPDLILLADKYGGFHAGERHRAQREVDLLRARADRIEQGGQP